MPRLIYCTKRGVLEDVIEGIGEGRGVSIVFLQRVGGFHGGQSPERTEGARFLPGGTAMASLYFLLFTPFSRFQMSSARD